MQFCLKLLDVKFGLLIEFMNYEFKVLAMLFGMLDVIFKFSPILFEQNLFVYVLFSYLSLFIS